MGSSSPSFGVKIKNVWNRNHHLVTPRYVSLNYRKNQSETPRKLLNYQLKGTAANNEQLEVLERNKVCVQRERSVGWPRGRWCFLDDFWARGEFHSSKERKIQSYKLVSKFRFFFLDVLTKKSKAIYSVPSIEKNLTNKKVVVESSTSICRAPFLPKCQAWEWIERSFFKRPKRHCLKQLLGTSFCWRKPRKKSKKSMSFLEPSAKTPGLGGCVGKKTRY